MAHLWLKTETEQWAVLQLEADAFVLTDNPPRPLRDAHSAIENVSGVLLLSDRSGVGEAAWVLVCGRAPGVRVNGVSLTLGVRVLADRDEIFLGGSQRLYFSTENLARVEAFPGAEQAIYCPRCKQEIERASAAVKCPQCRVWYHQSEELPCWSYAETCALCPQLTALDAGYRWTPEGL